MGSGVVCVSVVSLTMLLIVWGGVGVQGVTAVEGELELDPALVLLVALRQERQEVVVATDETDCAFTSSTVDCCSGVSVERASALRRSARSGTAVRSPRICSRDA